MPAARSGPLVYTGITGPTNFGGGGSTRASSGSGDIVSVSGAARLVDVPAFYLSGTALSDSMTFDSATFASLGATPGTYTWTWGSGVNAHGPQSRPDQLREA
jgi:hypothetical protein